MKTLQKSDYKGDCYGLFQDRETKERRSISFTPTLLDRMDALVDSEGSEFESRSGFVREACRRLVEDETGEVVRDE
ncbi:MAG: ribbon-helix-helix domain-containing protein [Candidatus Nanohaloarchaea archaeon]